MIIKPTNEDYDNLDNEEDDFIDVKPSKAERPKEPKKPVLKPENPAYWEEEDEFEHIRNDTHWRNRRLWAWTGGAIALLCILWIAYLHWLQPYSEGAVQYGYVEKIERRGDIFKTFEGTLIPYRSIADTIEPYEGDLVFSVADDPTAAQLRRLFLANLPARVEYRRYHAPLPWRGDATVVITRVDTADPAKIFPPQLNHPLIPQKQNRK